MRRMLIGIVLVVAVGGLVALFAFRGDDEGVEPATQDETPEATSTPPPAPSDHLGIRLVDFREQWNTIVTDELDRPDYEIPGMQIRAGEEQNLYRYELPDGAVIEGVADRGVAEPRELEVSVDAGNLEAGTVPVSWTALVRTLSPDLDEPGREELMEELGVLGADDDSTPDGTAVRGGVRYEVGTSEDGAVFLLATAA